MHYYKLIILVAALAGPIAAQGKSDESKRAVAAVTAFHAAVKAGNAAAAMKLTAGDAVFLESGGIESRMEYETNHLPADIEFEKAVPVSYTTFKVVVVGNAAWVTSTAEMKGTFEGKPVNSALVELMVLSRESGEWRIRIVHWSSRRL